MRKLDIESLVSGANNNIDVGAIIRIYVIFSQDIHTENIKEDIIRNQPKQIK